MSSIIFLTQNQETIVDEHFSYLAGHKWHADWNKDIQSYYARRTVYINGRAKRVYLHRHIMELHLGRPLEFREKVDHINHDTLDNRLENLAVKSNRGNALNSKKRRDNTSGYIGVVLNKRTQKWLVRTYSENIQIHIGYFTNLEYAARERDRAYLYFGGEDAVKNSLNFPDEIEIRRQELQENVYKWMKGD